MSNRVFPHFPQESVCPFCQTNKDIECVLIAINETIADGLAEGQPFHLQCILEKLVYVKDRGVIAAFIHRAEPHG